VEDGNVYRSWEMWTIIVGWMVGGNDLLVWLGIFWSIVDGRLEGMAAMVNKYCGVLRYVPDFGRFPQKGPKKGREHRGT
jgi:hypothetical protein